MKKKKVNGIPFFYINDEIDELILLMSSKVVKHFGPCNVIITDSFIVFAENININQMDLVYIIKNRNPQIWSTNYQQVRSSFIINNGKSRISRNNHLIM